MSEQQYWQYRPPSSNSFSIASGISEIEIISSQWPWQGIGISGSMYLLETSDCFLVNPSTDRSTMTFLAIRLTLRVEDAVNQRSESISKFLDLPLLLHVTFKLRHIANFP